MPRENLASTILKNSLLNSRFIHISCFISIEWGDISHYDMSLNLNEINPKFRQLTDLLLFSDQMDLDLSEYKFLLRSNQTAHYPYFWDRFQKASEIFWEKG